MEKKALVTGATGQDGSYLVELLLEKGYTVSALDRRKSVPNDINIAHVGDKVKMEMGDINDAASISRLVSEGFDEIYHLAAQSDVGISFTQPYFTFTNNSVSTLSFLENIRVHSPETKFYFAGTSEMYGGLQKEPYSETSPFHPRSPYGVSKLAGYWLVRNYREAYGLKCCSGILFNHESERRGGNFVTKKICDWVRGLQDYLKASFGTKPFSYEVALKRMHEYVQTNGNLRLGNLEARRDWGYAPDYVEGMWRILNQNEIKGKPEDHPMEDYVLGTGIARSVREFVEIAFQEALDVKIEWKKIGEITTAEGGNKKYQKEVGCVKGGNVCDVVLVEIDEEFYRPSEVNVLIADPTKVKRDLRWNPKHSFNDLVKRMLRLEVGK